MKNHLKYSYHVIKIPILDLIQIPQNDNNKQIKNHQIQTYNKFQIKTRIH